MGSGRINVTAIAKDYAIIYGPPRVGTASRETKKYHFYLVFNHFGYYLLVLFFVPISASSHSCLLCEFRDLSRIMRAPSPQKAIRWVFTTNGDIAVDVSGAIDLSIALSRNRV